MDLMDLNEIGVRFLEHVSIYIDDVTCLHMILDTPDTLEAGCSAQNACLAILKA